MFIRSPRSSIAACLAVLLASGLAASASAQSATLYAIGNGVVDGSSNLYKILNYATSPLAYNLGETGVKLLDIAINPVDGKAFGISGNGNLYTINLANAQVTRVGNCGVSNLNALDFDANGSLFAWGSGPTNLYRLNTATAAATLIGNVGFPAGGDLTFDCAGNMYGASGTQFLRISSTNGAATVVGSTGISGFFGMDIGPDGKLYAAKGAENSGAVAIYTIEISSGTPTFIANVAGVGAYGIYGLAFDKMGVPPTFTTQPSGLTVCSGQDVTLTAAGSGEGLIYAWKKDGVFLSDRSEEISGVNTPTLHIYSADTADAGSYVCNISSGCSNADSQPAVLAINSAAAPQITQQPAPTTACPGNTVGFTVTATGDSVSYQWTKNNTNLSNAEGKVSGATTNAISISSITPDDAADYRCVITGPCVSVTSDAAHLTIGGDAPVITNSGTSGNNCAGGTYTLDITATPTEGLTYSWTLGGVAVTDIPGKIAGSATAHLSISNLSLADNGDYVCTVSDGCGQAHATLNVAACVADFNCDGFVDIFDFSDFIDAFEQGLGHADVNGDQFLDIFDFNDFITGFEAGCDLGQG